MADPLDTPPPADHGSDRYGYVETIGAPDGVFPPDRLVDQMFASLCQDCNPNLFLRWVPLDAPVTDPPTDWVDVHGHRWHVTVAHDETCPTATEDQ